MKTLALLTLLSVVLPAISVAAVSGQGMDAATTPKPEGNPMDDPGFKAALQACAEAQGLKQLPQRDQQAAPGEPKLDTAKFQACLTAKGYPPPDGDKQAKAPVR